MKKLSIITINRNNSAGLRKTIESVVSQTFTDYEYIVIDGASTDDSVDVIGKYADKIHYWVSESDNGIYNAMNKGIEQAKGEYIQFLNSGDWFYSDKVLNEVFGTVRTEDIIYGDAVLYKNDLQFTNFIYPAKLTAFYLINWMICHQAIFHKRTLFQYRNYNEKYKIVADWEFLLNAFIIENCTSLKVNNFIIFNDGHGVSSDYDLVKKERDEVLEKYLPKKIIEDYSEYYELKELSNKSSLFPFLSIFQNIPDLQRLLKKIMKVLLIITGNKEKIPSEK